MHARIDLAMLLLRGIPFLSTDHLNVRKLHYMKTGIVFLILFANLSLVAQSNSTTKTMNTEKVTVEIWSDVVCPFCLLGKKKIEQAIAKLNATNNVEIIWRSFQLDPTFPKNTSSPSMQYLSERKGYPVNQIKGMCQQLSLQGKKYGINFNFDASLTINTFDAHRLIHWAKSFGKANQLKEALMVAHFSEGMDLSKETQLFSIIEKVGLDTDEAKTILQSDN